MTNKKDIAAWNQKHESVMEKVFDLLFPVPGSLEDALSMQTETFERRERDRNAVCRNEYGHISVFYGIRTILCTVGALLVIILGFVIFPVHDGVREPIYWWECPLQCAVYWTGLIIFKHT